MHNLHLLDVVDHGLRVIGARPRLLLIRAWHLKVQLANVRLRVDQLSSLVQAAFPSTSKLDSLLLQLFSTPKDTAGRSFRR